MALKNLYLEIDLTYFASKHIRFFISEVTQHLREFTKVQVQPYYAIFKYPY